MHICISYLFVFLAILKSIYDNSKILFDIHINKNPKILSFSLIKIPVQKSWR